MNLDSDDFSGVAPDERPHFASAADLPHGMTVDRAYIRSCQDRADRRVLVQALVERQWDGLDDLLEDLAEAFSYDPGWVEDVWDLVVRSESLWAWARGLDLGTLNGFAMHLTEGSFSDPLVQGFFQELLSSIERRADANFSADARLLSSRVEELLTLSEH